MARTLVNAHQMAALSGSTATVAKFAQGVYTGGLSMESGSLSSVGGISFYNGGAIDYVSNKINLFQNTNIDGTLTCDTSITVDSVTLTDTELGYLDGLTLGTAAASKVMTLDATADVTGARNITLSGELDAATGDFSGDIDVDGTANLDAVDIDGVVQIDGATTWGVDGTGVDVKLFGDTAGSFMLWDQSADALLLTDSTPIQIGDAQDMTLYHDGTNSFLTNKTGAMKIATETSGIAITLGHGTSEVTVADNLTVAGNLTVTGTTTTVDVEVVNTANGVIFEGATADDFELTLKSVDPTADRTVQIADAAGFLIPFAAVSTTAISSTPAELNKLDGAGASVTAAKLTTLTALTDAEIGYLDGAAAGTAAASKAVVLDGSADTAGMRNLTLSGDITIDDGGSLKEAGGTAAFTFDGSGHITKIGQSTHTTDFALTWDGSKAVWSESGVSGSAAHYSTAGLRTSGYLNVSGSSIIGDAAGDTHQITGSLEVSNIANFTSAVNAEADLTCGGLFKMADNTSTKFLVADGTSYQEVAMSGHATMGNDGAVTLAADAVQGSHIALFDDSLAATTTHFLIADGTDYSSFALSGDVTCTNAGVVTIGAGAVENSMLADDAVGADELASNAVVNASVASAAGIAYSKMEAVTAGQIMVGNVSNVGTLVAVSGDVTMSNAGVVTIAAGAVEHGMLAEDIISGQAALGSAAVAQADLLMLDDGPGTVKKVTFSNFEDSIFGNVSGDATVAAGGALTIAATAVEGTMLNSNCGGNGIAVVSNALVVDFGMERCIGSSGDGYTTASGVYTLPTTPVSGSEMVFLNGQMLYRGDTTDAAAGSGDYSTATGSIELHADLKLDADDVLQVYFLL